MSVTIPQPAAAAAVPLRPGRPVQPCAVNFAMLTHDGLEDTQRCLESLAETTPILHNVFVLDNASQDETVAWLQGRRESHLHAFGSDVNHGVAGGRNVLLDLVLPHVPDGGFVVFVDNDLEFTSGWLEPFLQLFSSQPRAGMAGVVGHEIVVHDGERTLLPSPRRTAPVDVVSGGYACWVRVEAAREIGHFDIGTGQFWHEDDDYSVRALAAGWEVFAVPEAVVLHHAHGSGVAIDGLRDGGSKSVQRYLIHKWTRAGWVDRDGWIVRGDSEFYLGPESRDALQTRIGRDGPIDRRAWGTASWDVHRLATAIDRDDEVDAWPIAPTDLHFGLLAHLAERAGTEGRDDHAECERVLSAMAEGLEASHRSRDWNLAERTSGGLNRICDASDYDDPQWCAMARRVSRVRAGAPLVRHRAVWERAHLVHGLEHLGVLRSDAMGLSVGAGVEPMLWQLPDRVRLLVGVDLYDERAETEFDVPSNLPQELARHAPEGTALDRLRVLGMDARLLEFGDDRFDFVYSAGMLQSMDGYVEAQRALSEMARVVKPGGIVAIVTDVVLEGMIGNYGFSIDELGGDLFRDCGLELVEPFDSSIAEATVAGWIPRVLENDWMGRTRDVTVTSAVVFLRKPESPARPEITVVDRTIVAFDARTFDFESSVTRGIGNYTAQHLRALAESRPDWLFRCYSDGPPSRALQKLLGPDNVEHRRVESYRADEAMVHIPDPMTQERGFDAPLRVFRHQCQSVLFHDLTPLRCYWKAWSPDLRFSYLSRLNQVRDGSSLVLTNSEHTRSDVIGALRLPEHRVHAVMAGLNRDVGRDAAEAADIDEVRARWGIVHPYFLHVGALDPHKNFEGVLEAVRKAGAEAPCHLIVAGPVDANMAHFSEKCASEGITGVLFTGFLPRAELEALYAHAVATVFLSFYEGFGFPALEAMARGCPVVASDRTSLPEVVGDAGLLVPPDDSDAAAAVLARLLVDPGLREELRRRGPERAERFTWQSTAERTLAAWESAFALAQ